MTTITEPNLSTSLQRLVDARLDTIDRMLLGRVDRQDRLAIVREVESQIHDLLGGRSTESIDRDDILAILARLDPPEAYLPDETGERPASSRVPSPGRIPSPVPGSQERISRISGIVGLASVGTIFLSVLMLVVVESMGTVPVALAYIGIFGPIVLTFVLGLTALSLASYARLRGAWAVVGLVTGILSTIASSTASGWLLSLS